jgi:hypothetical protein
MTKDKEAPRNSFTNLKGHLSEELNLILEIIEKYQKTVQPIISKTKCLLEYLVEEVYNLGTAQTIGSFCNNLHLPWSDLNIFVNCNSKKNFNNKSKYKNMLLIRRK